MVTTRTHVYVDGETLTAALLNNEFNNLLNAPAIANADISASAGIVFSKLDSATVAGVSATQTFTNKTLTKPTINGSTQAYTTDSDGATVTFDMTASNVHTVEITASRVLAVSNVSTGQIFTVIIKQGGSGSNTVTWWGSIKWQGAAAPTLTTTAGRWDIFTFVFDGSQYYGTSMLNFG